MSDKLNWTMIRACLGIRLCIVEGCGTSRSYYRVYARGGWVDGSEYDDEQMASRVFDAAVRLMAEQIEAVLTMPIDPDRDLAVRLALVKSGGRISVWAVLAQDPDESEPCHGPQSFLEGAYWSLDDAEEFVAMNKEPTIVRRVCEVVLRLDGEVISRLDEKGDGEPISLPQLVNSLGFIV
jgi:hypothetical protein